MTSQSDEPTRPIGQPTLANDGTLRAKTALSPKACRVRARISIPPTKVMPIIVVPGIMGTNLRANTEKGSNKNSVLRPGEPAWRPPNSIDDGLEEANVWKKRDPATRQKMLNGHTLEVDPTGPIEFQGHATLGEVTPDYARDHGWGEIHWASYGDLLIGLKLQFGKFLNCTWEHLAPDIDARWVTLNTYDRRRWQKARGELLASFSVSEIEKIAKYWYPIYACGYNWLLSNESSASRLRKRIEEIISKYKSAGFECEKVLLVTHSMGGLVARACAKQIEKKIAGIVHVCMPALGAPVCYRRIACGTEPLNPSHGEIDNISEGKFADIAGRTAAETNAVMAHAPGALELLPTHLYPSPWLYVLQKDERTNANHEHQLPFKNPYDMYRDTTSWYRLFQPKLVDPAGQYPGREEEAMRESVDQSQKFHESILGSYYHPNSFAIYGADREQLSYGRYTWIRSGLGVLDQNTLMKGKHVSSTFTGQRSVEIPGGRLCFFTPSVQDTAGDGTVPAVSGAGIAANTKGTFVLSGFDHQQVFGNSAARALTIQLMARAILMS